MDDENQDSSGTTGLAPCSTCGSAPDAPALTDWDGNEYSHALPMQLLGSIDVNLARRADGSGHAVVEPGTGMPLVTGQTAQGTWDAARDIAAQLGRRRVQAAIDGATAPGDSSGTAYSDSSGNMDFEINDGLDDATEGKNVTAGVGGTQKQAGLSDQSTVGLARGGATSPLARPVEVPDGFDAPVRASDAGFVQDVLGRRADAKGVNAVQFREDVREMQALLVSAGLLDGRLGEIDGHLGGDTLAAARNFVDAARIAQSDDSLGEMTPIYETSRAGIGAISSGRNDPGGISYGPYQLTSAKGNTMSKFLGSDAGQPYKDLFFGDLRPGTPQFNDIYRSVAEQEGDVFAGAQRDYVKQSNYDAAAQKAKEAGFDLSDRGVQEAVFSLGVQFSPQKYQATIDDAVAASGGKLPDDPDAQISALYQARGRQYPRDAINRYAPEQGTARLISAFHQQGQGLRVEDGNP